MMFTESEVDFFVNEAKKKQRKEIQDDLDELVEWCKYLPVDSGINIKLGRKVEKWEDK